MTGDKLALGVVSALALAAVAKKGGTATPQGFTSPARAGLTGAQLRALVRTEEALRVLDEDPDLRGTGWGEGGCGVLAMALLRVLPGSALYAITWRGHHQRYLVRHQGLFFDHDGARVEGAVLQRWSQDYPERGFARGARLEPAAGVDVEAGILASREAVQAMERLLRGHLRGAVGSRASEQAVTSTPAFQRWFADSEVVDQAGAPRVMYHATSEDFEAFRNPYAKDVPDGGWHMFTNDPDYANAHAQGLLDAPRVLPVYLRVRRAIDLTHIPTRGRRALQILDDLIEALLLNGVCVADFEHQPDPSSEIYGIVNQRGFRADLRRALMAEGFDGIKMPDVQGGVRATTYIVFEPTQIKSAIGNQGTFDPKDPRISFNRAPGRGSRAQDQNSSASVRVIPLDALTQEWQEHRERAASESDLPVLWSDHAPRDALLMLDISGDILDRIEGGYDEEDALQEVHEDLQKVAAFFNRLSFPVEVYRGVNVTQEDWFERTLKSGDFGAHWSVSQGVAEAFAHGLHEYAESVRGQPAVLTGTIRSPGDVQWRYTFAKFLKFSLDDPNDHYRVELQLYGPKVFDVKVSRPKKRRRRW